MGYAGELRSGIEPAAVEFWSLVCTQASELVDDARRTLGAHLRESPFELHQVSEVDHGVAVLRAGRCSLEIVSPFLLLPPSPREQRLESIFGAHTALARIFVYRGSIRSRLAVRAWLAFDPSTGYWASGNPDIGPAPRSDLASLHAFLWSLFTDHLG